MTVLSDKQLYEAGLSTDEVTGFREAMRQRYAKSATQVLAPEHFRGPRLENFERGARIAYFWKTMRNAAGRARRRWRHEERQKTGGMCTVIDREETAAEAVEYLLKAIEYAGKRRAP